MKIIILLFFALAILFSANAPASAHLALPDVARAASQPTGFTFLIVTYKNASDIKFLFQESSRVLGYFEDIEGGEPFFLALVSDEQKKNIEKKGYRVRIMDTNTILSNYMLLYNHQINQSEKLAKYAQVFSLSPHYTLIKLESNKEFDPHSIPDAVEFGPVPFLEGISPPTQIVKVVTPTPIVVGEKTENKISIVLVSIFIVGTILIASLSTFLAIALYKKKKSRELEGAESRITPPQEI